MQRFHHPEWFLLREIPELLQPAETDRQVHDTRRASPHTASLLPRAAMPLVCIASVRRTSFCCPAAYPGRGPEITFDHFVGADVPDHYGSPTVLAGRNDPFEIQILDRVI